MEAGAVALLVTIEAEDADSVENLKKFATNNLDLFASRKTPPPFEWSATEDR
jgi:hypothetical protein